MIFNKQTHYTGTLTPEQIDKWSELTEEFCRKLKLESGNIIRYRYTLEECLLNLREKIGSEQKVEFTIGYSFAKPFFRLEFGGETYNPFRQQEDDVGIFGVSILKQIGISLIYSYKSDRNILSFSIKGSAKSLFLPIIIVAVAAILVSGTGVFLPDTLRATLLSCVFDPLHEIFLSFLSCIAGTMIFLSVAWGIYGFGDVHTLSRTGRGIILSVLRVTVLFSVGTVVCCLPIFDLYFAENASGSAQASAIMEMIAGYFPNNIVTPFADGNSIQLILMAIITGIAMLFLGKQTTAVARAIEQVSFMIQFMMELIYKLVPFFIFIILVRLFWEDSASSILYVWKLPLCFFIISLVLILIYVVYTSVITKTNPVTLILKNLPSYLIALTTASSAVAFATVTNTCRNKFGIDDSVTNFGIPLSIVISMPTTAVFNIVAAFYFAEYYCIDISIGWIITAIIICSILAVAIPPIPGGALSAYIILFLQLGIPGDAVAIVLALDVFVDFLITGFDIFVNPFILINQSRKLGRLNYNILRYKNIKGKNKIIIILFYK